MHGKLWFGYSSNRYGNNLNHATKHVLEESIVWIWQLNYYLYHTKICIVDKEVSFIFHTRWLLFLLPNPEKVYNAAYDQSFSQDRYCIYSQIMYTSSVYRVVDEECITDQLWSGKTVWLLLFPHK